MKRLLLFAALIFGALAMSNQASAQEKQEPQLTSYGEWLMAKEGYWLGRIDGKAWWYRVSPEGEVTRSADARNWETAESVVGKDEMGVKIRLTEDEVVFGEDVLNAWMPVTQREWDKEKGLNYQNDYNKLIWSLEPPKLYRKIM